MDHREDVAREVQTQAAQQQAHEEQTQAVRQQAREEQTQAAHQQARTVRRIEQQSGANSIVETMLVIEKIENVIRDAKRVPFSRSKVTVDAGVLEDLFGQLHIALPKAVTQAQSIIANSQSIVDSARAKADQTADEAEKVYKDTVNKAKKFKEDVIAEMEEYEKAVRARAQEEESTIIADAQMRANQTILAAQEKAQDMLDKNEITRRANAYALETRDRAEADADSILNQAYQHADKVLTGASVVLSRSARDIEQAINNLRGGQNWEQINQQ